MSTGTASLAATSGEFSLGSYGGADWTTPYFDEFSRSVRVDWKEHVGWWQRPRRNGRRRRAGHAWAAPDAAVAIEDRQRAGVERGREDEPAPRWTL